MPSEYVLWVSANRCIPLLGALLGAYLLGAICSLSTTRIVRGELMKNYLLGAFVVLLLASCVDVSGSGSASATKKKWFHHMYTKSVN